MDSSQPGIIARVRGDKKPAMVGWGRVGSASLEPPQN